MSSSKEGGTLYQLRNLINRRNVAKKPKKDVAACEDFFELVVEAHIVTAAMKVFNMSSVNDTPSSQHFPEGSPGLPKQQRIKLVLLATRNLVNELVDVSFPSASNKEMDHVLAYARELISLSLLFAEFRDAIREGDGLRILRCWRVFLPIFKATNRTNYSIEALTMLAQYHFLFTERLKKQLLWSRTVNTSGRPGKNIPCDLHMEHLNRECKQAMGTLGPNISRENSVRHIGKSIGSISNITATMDRQIGVKRETGKHSVRNKAKDFTKVLKQLLEAEVFTSKRKRITRVLRNSK